MPPPRGRPADAWYLRRRAARPASAWSCCSSSCSFRFGSVSRTLRVKNTSSTSNLLESFTRPPPARRPSPNDTVSRVKPAGACAVGAAPSSRPLPRPTTSRPPPASAPGPPSPRPKSPKTPPPLKKMKGGGAGFGARPLGGVGGRAACGRRSRAQPPYSTSVHYSNPAMPLAAAALQRYTKPVQSHPAAPPSAVLQRRGRGRFLSLGRRRPARRFQ